MRKIIYIQDHEIFKYNGRYFHPKSKHYFSRYLVGLHDGESLTVYTGIREVNNETDIMKYQDVTNPRIEYIKVPEFRRLSNLPQIYSIVKKAVKEADYCYLRTSISSTIACYFCKKMHKPYLAIITGDPFESAYRHSRLIVRLAAYPLLLFSRYLISNANAALYVTQQYLQSKYPCKGEILGCSDVEYLTFDENILPKRIKKIEKKRKIVILGSVGNISTNIKGHDTVIRALAKLKSEGHSSYLYQLVGTGNKSRLLELAKKQGVDDMIQFMGEYSHDKVLKWFETIDIYIHPSRSEGLPRTILEAITKATPCICSSVGGIPELIDNDYLFNYDGNEVESCANLIKKMNSEEMKRMAERNYNHSKNYNPNVLESRRNSFLRDMLERSCI